MSPANAEPTVSVPGMVEVVADALPGGAAPVPLTASRKAATLIAEAADTAEARVVAAATRAEDTLAAAADRARAQVQAHVATSEAQQLHDNTLIERADDEKNRVTAGQRSINLLWETTQRQVALSVIGASLIVAMLLAVGGKWMGTPTELQLAASVFMFSVANLVTGFYFGRTNHQKIGGVQQGR